MPNLFFSMDEELASPDPNIIFDLRDLGFGPCNQNTTMPSSPVVSLPSPHFEESTPPNRQSPNFSTSMQLQTTKRPTQNQNHDSDHSVPPQTNSCFESWLELDDEQHQQIQYQHQHQRHQFQYQQFQYQQYLPDLPDIQHTQHHSTISNTNSSSTTPSDIDLPLSQYLSTFGMDTEDTALPVDGQEDEEHLVFEPQPQQRSLLQPSPLSSSLASMPSSYGEADEDLPMLDQQRPQSTPLSSLAPNLCSVIWDENKLPCTFQEDEVFFAQFFTMKQLTLGQKPFNQLLRDYGIRSPTKVFGTSKKLRERFVRYRRRILNRSQSKRCREKRKRTQLLDAEQRKIKSKK